MTKEELIKECEDKVENARKAYEDAVEEAEDAKRWQQKMYMNYAKSLIELCKAKVV